MNDLIKGTHNVFFTAADRASQIGLPENSTWSDVQRHGREQRAVEVVSNAKSLGIIAETPASAHEIYKLNCKIASVAKLNR